jgi:hypothetical protein
MLGSVVTQAFFNCPASPDKNTENPKRVGLGFSIYIKIIKEKKQF